MDLVSEARSKIVSRVMGSCLGSREREPKARRYTTSPLCPTRTTAPGIFPSATAFSKISSTAVKRGSRFSSILSLSPRANGTKRNEAPRNSTNNKKGGKAQTGEVYRLYIMCLVFYKAAGVFRQAGTV